jgi:sugar phosphate permease
MVAGMFGDLTLPELLKGHNWQEVNYYGAMLGIVVGTMLFIFLRDGYKRSSEKDEKCHLSVSMDEVLINLKRLFFCRHMWINGIIGCLMWLPISVFAETWGISYLQQVHGLPHAQAAHACLLVFMGWATGGPVVGYVSDLIRRRVLLLWVGALLSGICFATILFAPHLSHLSLCLLLFFFGFFNSPQVIIFALAREISSPKASGTALAFTNMFTMLSGFCFQPISGFLMDWLETSEEAIHTHIYSAHAYQGALSMLLVSFGLTVVLCIFLKESHCRQMSLIKD